MIHYRKLRGEPEDSFAKSLLEDLAALSPCEAFYYDYVDLPNLIGYKFSSSIVVIMVRDLIYLYLLMNMRNYQKVSIMLA